MRWTALILILLLAACGKAPPNEEEFSRMLTNATLVGQFTSGKSGPPKEDRYAITKVTKTAGDLWLVHARIQYGDHDVTVPVPVKVQWAGDTPVMSLTDVTLPKLGTFTVRLVFYRDQYAGMWSSSNGHGGQMFGRIERPAK